MFKPASESSHRVTERLAAKGYWPAQAARLLAAGEYARAVETCRANLADEKGPVSGHLIYGRALYYGGQAELAAEEFYHVLGRDPDNLVALKYLGDIKFAEGDEVTAMAHYRRILEIDPDCGGLKSELARPAKKETTRTVTLSRPGEKPHSKQADVSLRDIPFLTETMGDLYLSQGYARLAAEVFRALDVDRQNPRLAEKLAKAEQSIKDKER